MTFMFYSDPGHGWLRVDIASAWAVGLKPEDFSQYSYRHSHWLYLEEDCDATKFVVAFQLRHHYAPPIRYHHSNRSSVIRNYPRIAA